ncbi:hypothetical protein P3448_24240, partial [Vibrio parahaemolyticus]|nr:hypothetical protein [Vibrio parahaemolyticus]
MQPLLFVVVYCAPGPYSEFVSEFSEFLSSLVLNSDKVIIVGDFNIHVDVDNDSCVYLLVRLHLVPMYGIKIDNLRVFPQNPSLSDHYLITFDFFLLDYTPLSNSYYTRCLSDSAVAKLKEKITSSLHSIPIPSVTEVSRADFNLSRIDHFVDSTVGSLRTTLDSVAPLKKKLKKQ